MGIRNGKVYFDGSHYVVIDSEKYPRQKGKRNTYPKTTAKKIFEQAYSAGKALSAEERNRNIEEKLSPIIQDKTERDIFIKENLEREKRNRIVRRMRLYRKVNQQDWHYFCTFTYDDKKHTEETFRKALSNCLRHLSSRKGWKYIGVWERSPTNSRLHFHAIFVIPTMIGSLIEVRDYSTKTNRMQISYQNTHFLEKFGRNDFKPIGRREEISFAVKYIIKYIEKSGEKIIYSRNLPTYYRSDIFDDDIICYFDEYERKAVLSDNFVCMVDGEILGNVSPEVLDKLPKFN